MLRRILISTFLSTLSLVAPYGIDENDIESDKAVLRLADKEFLSNGNRTRSVLCMGFLSCSQLSNLLFFFSIFNVYAMGVLVFMGTG